MYKIRLSKEELLTEEEVRKWILCSEKAVKRAAIVIFQAREDNKKNHYGFNAWDKDFLTLFAINCLNNINPTVGELHKARRLLIKYSGQIAKITNDKKWIQYEFDFDKFLKQA